MDKKVKIYTWFNPPPVTPEVNTEPSLTDDTFFEPLNVLVERIIRGESTTFMDAYKGEFDYDADDDAVLDDLESDYEMDDLTDIDDARQTVSSMQASNFSQEKLRSQAMPKANGATVSTGATGDSFVTGSTSEVADGERRETADGNEEQKK